MRLRVYDNSISYWHPFLSMAKKTFAGLIIGLVVLFSVGVLPASALTVDEIQSQIQSLLSRITELTSQLNILRGQTETGVGTSVSGSIMPSKHRVCTVLYRNLSQGTRGDDVTSLQEFLQSEGHLSANATGYFGPLTAQAVAKWQSSQGVSAVGHFGPMSRERIKVWCGGGWNNSERFSAAPQRGTAPLTVTFKTNVEIPGPFIADANGYKIVFGDGQEQTLNCSTEMSETSIPGGGYKLSGPYSCHSNPVSHTYVADGTYTASLVSYGGFCAYPCPETVVAKVQIHVGQNVDCTKEYKPVCGSHQIYCITTPCNPIQQTYSNRCMMASDGATFVHEGQCRGSYTNPADDPQCKSWNDGLYCGTVCSRSEPGGVPRCVAKMCAAIGPENAVPRCTAWFDNGNKPPVISGFSGPTTLALNATGTWSIDASDPENGSLSYSVRWGDEPVPMGLSSPSSAYDREFVQTTTFTHAYVMYGTFTISVIVRDSNGAEAKTSTTVRVTTDSPYCTQEYAPVCGQPPEPACRHSIPACMMATPGPQTYGNRCTMNAAGASFLYEGQCANGY